MTMQPLKPLTRREWEVLEQLLQGRSNKQIALALDISIRTVEFHLKNIYQKYNAASRVELILALRVPAEPENPVSSTVAAAARTRHNGGRLQPVRGWAASFRKAVSEAGRELEMKNLFTTLHVPAGIAAALLAGCAWIYANIALLNMAVAEIKPLIVPLLIVWVLIGGAVGLSARRFGNSVLKAAVTALLATGAAPISILPLMGFVVYPIAKLLERIGLINAATMPRDTATALAIIAMLGLWLLVATGAGVLLNALSLRKTVQEAPQS